MNLNDFDVEQLVAYEGYEYKLCAGQSGLQVNVKTCPNCGREDFKVYLNAETGLGNCFGCDVKYNKFSFIKLSRGLTKNGDVFRYLQGINSYVTYKPKRQIIEHKLNKDWVLPLNTRIELDQDLPDYLKDRNIDAKICKRFDLRYCDAGFYKYQDWFEKTKYVDFSKRIIIPVKDINGSLVTFQGRDITGKSNKKYLFPNMLPGTGRYIYNADYIIKNKLKKVILCEGVFDVFAATQAIETDVTYMQWGVAGTFGKHLSIRSNNVMQEDQLSDLMMLKSCGVDEFVIMWDGERKARLAAIDACLQLRSYGLNASVALDLPDGCDPNEATINEVLSALNKRIIPTKLSSVTYRLR